MYYYNRTVQAGKLADTPTFSHGKKPEKTDDRAWFILAVNRYKDSKEPNYIPVTVWGKLARVVRDYCDKGKSVMVEGELNSWYTIKPGGQRQNHLGVTANRVILGESPEYVKNAQPAKADVDSEVVLKVAMEIAKQLNKQMTTKIDTPQSQSK